MTPLATPLWSTVKIPHAKFASVKEKVNIELHMQNVFFMLLFSCGMSRWPIVILVYSKTFKINYAYNKKLTSMISSPWDEHSVFEDGQKKTDCVAWWRSGSTYKLASVELKYMKIKVVIVLVRMITVLWGNKFIACVAVVEERRRDRGSEKVEGNMGVPSPLLPSPLIQATNSSHDKVAFTVFLPELIQSYWAIVS